MNTKKDGQWLREKLRAGETILGSHVFSGTPMLAEAIALAGFDMVWIDMEHTAIDKEAVLNCLIAVRAGEAASMVRIPWNDPVLAKPILDMGPDALLFPYIRTADEARQAVASCTYPPEGIRGYGPLRALEYGRLSPLDYVRNVHRNMIRAIQLEHIDAVNNLEEILDVEGVDMFIVGPNDLAGSMGYIGLVNEPEMMAVYDRLAKILVKAKRPFGVSTGYNPEVVKQWIDRGAQLIFSGYDTGYVYDGASAVYAGLQNIIGRK